MSRSLREPGPDHPIRLEPGRVRVSLGDDELAAAADAVMLFEAAYPAVAYVDKAALPADRLIASPTRTWCPYKGEASYFSLVTADGATLKDAVWCYEHPAPAVADIAGRLAFYPDKVSVVPL